MKGVLIWSAIAWAMGAAPTLGQTVFFDDFDGDALLPHWGQPSPSCWEHNVGGSILNVTALLCPSHPKSPTNFAGLSAVAAYAPQMDFQLDARLGWDASDTITRFDLTVTFGAGLVATIGYRPNPLSGPSGIVAATDAGVVAIPAPTSGMYNFRMTRTGSIFNFFFEGQHFASLPSAYTGPVNGVSFFFSSPYPGPSGPFHIDSVLVVPAPGALFFCAAVALGRARRRRR